MCCTLLARWSMALAYMGVARERKFVPVTAKNTVYLLLIYVRYVAEKGIMCFTPVHYKQDIALYF